MTLTDPKVFMEAMLSEMRRMIRVELEQVHERIDQMESAHEKLQNAPNVHRRERVQPREMRVEDEEPYRAGFTPDALTLELEIGDCRKLEFPLSEEMEQCYTSLERLEIRCSCDSLKFLPLGLFPKLHSLAIVECTNFETLVIPNEIQNVASLHSLSIISCTNMVSFPRGGLPASNLTFIWVNNCKNLKSLPEGMHLQLPSLQQLWIEECSELESFPEGGLPSNLYNLCIFNCKKLTNCRMEWGLQRLPYLKYFSIDAGIVEESFPEELLLPSSLTDLRILSFTNLKLLNHNGLKHLTSLQTLKIYSILLIFIHSTLSSKTLSFPSDGFCSLCKNGTSEIPLSVPQWQQLNHFQKLPHFLLRLESSRIFGCRCGVSLWSFFLLSIWSTPSFWNLFDSRLNWGRFDLSYKDIRLSSIASNVSSASNSSSSNSSSSTANSILPTQLHHFITIKLTRDNYLLWRAQLIPYLRGQNLFGYLDGSTPCLPITLSSSSNDSTIVPNPDYIHWSQQGQIILSALLSSLTESLLTQVVGLTTSRDVWLALEKTFSSTSSTRILSIHFQLSTLKKASLTITDYFTKVKQLSDTLSAISHPLSSSEITSYLLAGLPSSYDSLVTSITTRLDPISLDDLYGCLLTHENSLDQQNTSNDFTLPSANIATSYSGRGHRGSPSPHGAPHYGSRSRGRGRAFHNSSPHPPSHSTRPTC
ncbi:hypothetical protein F0562_030841 [Nyssa sinensis]|uniref:Uncharacterized protein n=1 Tax=Nyssa sinensis TaxID=561372 RepID=A0A5J5AZN5_9ASTE|nr:hypothetical protein F0562_030841 [Nyssa sinensis]